MTKKHFIALANMLKHTKPSTREFDPKQADFIHGQLTLWEDLREVLAEFCASQNPHFNRERWLAYIADECGPNGGRK